MFCSYLKGSIEPTIGFNLPYLDSIGFIPILLILCSY
jgi:hypothetical protein